MVVPPDVGIVQIPKTVQPIERNQQTPISHRQVAWHRGSKSNRSSAVAATNPQTGPAASRPPLYIDQSHVEAENSNTLRIFDRHFFSPFTRHNPKMRIHNPAPAEQTFASPKIFG
jgi:hypothetical protein